MNLVQKNPFFALSLTDARQHLWELDSLSTCHKERQLIYAQFGIYYDSIGGTKMYRSNKNSSDEITDLPF